MASIEDESNVEKIIRFVCNIFDKDFLGQEKLDVILFLSDLEEDDERVKAALSLAKKRKNRAFIQWARTELCPKQGISSTI